MTDLPPINTTQVSFHDGKWILAGHVTIAVILPYQRKKFYNTKTGQYHILA